MRRARVIAAALLCGCGSVLHGSLTADWQTQDKHWSMTPDECESGERSGFFGVDLSTQGNDAVHIRAILDPADGPIIKLELAGVDPPLTLTPESACKAFEFHVERQGSKTNKIADVRGHLVLDCTERDLALQADISFADCH